MRGVIHDIGYRSYGGGHLGRGAALLTLYGHCLRGVFGLGRTARAKVIPFVLATVMLLPAVVYVAAIALLKEEPPNYPAWPLITQIPLVIFLATQSPVLVATEMRYGVLPLYFSRPSPRGDYVVAKVAAMTTALLLLVAVPTTLMYSGALLGDPPSGAHTADYLRSLVGALMYALTLATAGLAIAASTPRRGLGIVSVIAVYLVLAATWGVLTGWASSDDRMDVARWFNLINPFTLIDAVQVWVLRTPPADLTGYPPGIGGPIATAVVLTLLGLAAAALALRYRKAAAA